MAFSVDDVGRTPVAGAHSWDGLSIGVFVLKQMMIVLSGHSFAQLTLCRLSCPRGWCEPTVLLECLLLLLRSVLLQFSYHHLPADSAHRLFKNENHVPICNDAVSYTHLPSPRD